MKFIFRFISILIIFLLAKSFVSFSQLNPLFKRHSKIKKIIEFPWKVPTAKFLADSIKVLETRPFDGTLFKANWPTSLVTSDPFASIFYEKQIDIDFMGIPELSKIKWGTVYTDNFVYAWTSVINPNWFNDKVWNNIQSNIRLISAQIKASKAKGLFLDTEDYGGLVWKYKNMYPDKTFDEVSAKVKQRGIEFIKALQFYKAEVKLIAAVLWIQTAWSANRNINNVENSDYALLKAFSDGLLEGADDKAMIIDGNEISYSWTNTVNWYSDQSAYKLVSDPIGLMDKKLLNKAKTNFQVGSSCYFENLVKPIYRQETNLKKLEHNVYQSLFNTDEYCWFYSEQSYYWSKRSLPKDIDSAIRLAKKKIKNNLPLGFTVSNDTSINISTLKILNPIQNSYYYVGDIINLKIELPQNNNYKFINYFINYERKIIDADILDKSTFIPLKAGWYHIFAYSNLWHHLSQKVDFFVKPRKKS